MKTFQLKFKTIVVLLLIGFAFSSCSKGDVPDPEPKNQAPNSFNLIEVADGATDVAVKTKWIWKATTVPHGDNDT